MEEVPGHTMVLFMYSPLNYPRHAWFCHTVTRFFGAGVKYLLKLFCFVFFPVITV